MHTVINRSVLALLIGALSAGSAAASPAPATARAARLRELAARFRQKQADYTALSAAQLHPGGLSMGLIVGGGFTTGKATIRSRGQEWTQQIYSPAVRLMAGASAVFRAGVQTYQAPVGTAPEAIIPRREIGLNAQVVIGAGLEGQYRVTPALSLDSPSSAFGLGAGFAPVGVEARLNFKGRMSAPRVVRGLLLARAGANLAERAQVANRSGDTAAVDKALQRMRRALSRIERDQIAFANADVTEVK